MSAKDLKKASLFSNYEDTMRDLAGSVYLISADGRVLNLPIPSRLRADPLNWSTGKRARAFFAFYFFACVGLTAVQGPGLMLEALSQEFNEKSNHVNLSLLVDAPALFMGVGAFIWIPLSLAIGRRTVFLLCAFILVASTALSGTAQNFTQYLVAVSLQGLAEGFSTSVHSPSADDNCLKELLVFGKVGGGWKAMGRCYPQVLICFLNPLIFWVALLEAAIFGGLRSLGSTYASVLSASPYFLPQHVVALINLTAAVGALLAWPASGLMIARLTRCFARRNSGVRDAEHYLAAFVLPVVASALSVIIYGYAVERKWHWIWIYVCFGLNTFGFAGLATANTLWATAAFPRWASAAMVVLVGGGYSASFGLSFAITPWIKSQGFGGANLGIGILILALGIVLVPMAYWGKDIRRRILTKWGTWEEGALRPTIVRRTGNAREKSPAIL
ncbi:hypothetical protein K469DRAFT_748034 [Zopfia rhizophila CBS 207.26]|uniref:MFS general substrate transporter n=1 Tax=Zopfia rhizophila CBS 207.26 TaxID=1314779 RepID=A0A6A6EEA8_9PEZI|nr:hypothetical protein K469DRAFT_748034 [Zopfia rhizophila CBS 207.26]